MTTTLSGLKSWCTMPVACAAPPCRWCGGPLEAPKPGVGDQRHRCAWCGWRRGAQARPVPSSGLVVVLPVFLATSTAPKPPT